MGLFQFAAAASSARDDLLGNGGGGVIIGAVAALIAGLGGGFGGSWLIGRQEQLRGRAAHKAAVRAVCYEMLANWSCLDAMARQKKKDFSLSDRIYVHEIRPLVDGLPANIGSKVAVAYFFAHSLHETHDDELVPLALKVTMEARDELLRYGERLGLTLIKPLQGAMHDAAAWWQTLDEPPKDEAPKGKSPKDKPPK